MSPAAKRGERSWRNALKKDDYALQEKKAEKGRRRSSLKSLAAHTAKAGRVISWKSLLAISLAFAGLSLSLIGVGAVSVWLYEKAITSDFFTTKHIDIAGNVRLSREMVLQYGGLGEGDNSLAISISDVERNLRDTPWVEEASVKRLLPDRFVIKIKERMPSFWVRKDGVLNYANEKGEIIAPVESKNFLSLPTLEILPGGEDAVPYLENLLKDIKNGALPLEAGAIASVRVSPAQGVEIFLEDREMRLSIAADDWNGNLQKLGLALSDLAKRRELGSVREARAVDGHVWIIKNKR